MEDENRFSSIVLKSKRKTKKHFSLFCSYLNNASYGKTLSPCLFVFVPLAWNVLLFLLLSPVLISYTGWTNNLEILIQLECKQQLFHICSENIISPVLLSKRVKHMVLAARYKRSASLHSSWCSTYPSAIKLGISPRVACFSIFNIKNAELTTCSVCVYASL